MSGPKIVVDQNLILEAFPKLRNLVLLKSGGQKDVYAAESDTYGPVVLKLMPCGENGTSPRICREINIVTSRSFTGVPRFSITVRCLWAMSERHTS